MCIRPLRRCLKRGIWIMPLSLYLHARASVCAAAAERRKQSASPETRANYKLSLYGG